MTRIEQIRQRADMLNHIVSAREIGPNESLQTLRDVDALLSAWDTRDAALRTLVERFQAAGDDDLNDYAVGYAVCADALDAILKETTHGPENSDRP